MVRLVLAIAAMLTLGACAIGNEYDYTAGTPALEARGSTSVTVAVADHRPYVLSGNKGADFVGLQRAGFGNPFDVTTTGGASLADQMAASVAARLRDRGFEAETLALAPGTGPEGAAFQTDRLLFLLLREWKSDAYGSVTMHHDADAVVYRRGGQEAGRARVQSTGPGGVAQVSPSATGVVAVSASSRKLAELLNDPAIVAALAGP